MKRTPNSDYYGEINYINKVYGNRRREEKEGS